jgi:hypothetical protein
VVEKEQGSEAPPEEQAPALKRSFTALRFVLYLLALAGLGLAGIGGYRGYLRVKAWLAGFGTGAYWILGLIAGFVYYDAAHRIHERIRERPEGGGRTAGYVLFSLVLLTLNPLSLSLALWLYSPSDAWALAGRWFFIGCSVGTGIVILLERLFAGKPAWP